MIGWTNIGRAHLPPFRSLLTQKAKKKRNSPYGHRSREVQCRCERDAGGHETPWAKVLAWEPPRRLLLGWQLDHTFRYDPDLLMEVEILFEEIAGGGTRVSLEHRHLEQLGAEAETFSGKVGSGWPERMGNFAHYAANQA